jgi:hypothetical protein
MKVKSFFYRNVKSTFNLPKLDFLLKGVIGNGNVLGLYCGSNTDYVLDSYNPTGQFYVGNIGNFKGSDRSVGVNNGTGVVATNPVGISTDHTKSGIESEISIDIDYIIKY